VEEAIFSLDEFRIVPPKPRRADSRKALKQRLAKFDSFGRLQMLLTQVKNRPIKHAPSARFHLELRVPEGTTGQDILAMPQHYPGEVTYQKDTKFTPITMRNFGDYLILGRDEVCTYAIDPQRTTGFVFSNLDIQNKPSLGMSPVMHAQLRESGIKGYKQVFRLRIREAFAQKGIATSWYLAYVLEAGGIVSDFDHLEGGKRLWKSFVRTAADRGLSISVVDTATKDWKSVGVNTADDFIWSTDPSRRRFVLVLEHSP
jgi:hypothetical protein